MENNKFEFKIENNALITGTIGKTELIKKMIKENIKNKQAGIVLGSFKKEYSNLEEETNGYLKIYGDKSNYKMNIIAVPEGVQPEKHFRAILEALIYIDNQNFFVFEMFEPFIRIFCRWSYVTENKIKDLLEEFKNEPSLIIKEKYDYLYNMIMNKELISLDDSVETKLEKLCQVDLISEEKLNEKVIVYNSKRVTLKHISYFLELFSITNERDFIEKMPSLKKEHDKFCNNLKKVTENEEFVNNFCYNKADQNLVTDFLGNKGIVVLDLNSFAKDSKLRGIINYILTADVYNFYSSFKGSKKRTVYLEDFSYNYYNFKYSKSKVNESKEYILRDIYENLLCCGRGAGIKVVVSALSKGDVSEIIQANCSENIYLNSNYPDSNKIQRELQIGEGLYYNGQEEPITFEYSSNIKIDKNKIRRKNGTKMGY